MDTPLDGSDPSGLKSLLDIVSDYNPFNGLVQGAQNAWNTVFGHVNVGACVVYCRSQDITGGKGSGAHVGLGVDVGAGIDLGPPVGFGGDLPSDPEWCAGIKLVNGCLDDQNHFGCQFSLGIGLGVYRQWTPKRPDNLW